MIRADKYLKQNPELIGQAKATIASWDEERRQFCTETQALKAKAILCANLMNKMESKNDRWLCQGFDRWSDLGRATCGVGGSWC
jgi:hypothetical protein